MFQNIPSNKKPFIAYLLLQNKTNAKIQLRVLCRDMQKPYTSYTDRIVLIDPQKGREIQLQFPLSSNLMQLQVYNMFTRIKPDAADPTYEAKVTKFEKIKTKDVWMESQDESFVKFAEEFSENAGMLSVGNYRSNDGVYLIKYLPYLTIEDKKGNVTMSSTPSRIGEITGNIEVSKRHFIDYSVPMRFLILLHEYAHKNINERKNKKMEDESAADLNALYIYLGRGYPRTDAKEVYLNIFLKARTEENWNRYQKIEEFIKRFDSKL